MKKFPRRNKNSGIVPCAMIKLDKTPPTELQRLALQLLRDQEDAGKNRTEIAKDLGVQKPNVSRWMNDFQNISGPMVERIIKVYIKMDTPTISKLLTALAEKQEFVKDFLTIETSDQEDAKNAIESLVKSLAKSIRR